MLIHLSIVFGHFSAYYIGELSSFDRDQMATNKNIYYLLPFTKKLADPWFR